MLVNRVRSLVRKFYPKEVDYAIESLLKKNDISLTRCTDYGWGIGQRYFFEHIMSKDCDILIQVSKDSSPKPQHDNYAIAGKWMVVIEVWRK